MMLSIASSILTVWWASPALAAVPQSDFHLGDKNWHIFHFFQAFLPSLAFTVISGRAVP